jgi:hypothetical protein
MSAIITTKFRYQTAVNLINAMGGNGSQTDDKYYLFIGRTEAWSDDDNPPLPEDSVQQEIDARYNMLSLKLITAPKISHVIPRYNWTSGQTYSEFDDQDDALTTKRFYVYTEDDLSVYKCIKAGSGASVVKPTGTDLTIGEVLSDGYQWKYMFTLTGSAIGTFTTSQFIPVKTLATDDLTYQWDVQQAAISGAIWRIKVTNGGTGYQSKPTVTIEGNGTGCIVQADDITLSGGVITQILVKAANVGQDYSQAKVVFTGGGPTSAAVARPIITPNGGHGSDPIQELGGYYSMITSTLSGDEGTGDFIVDNGFRQIGILRNPIDTITDEIGESTTYLACTKLEFSDLIGGEFAVGDTVIGATSGAEAIIDSVGTGFLLVHQNIGTGFTTFDVAESIEVDSVSATLDTITEPEIDLNSGQVLYIENISPVTRNENQTEDIKLVLEL